jgi:carbonic anhydrase/acetyltransferase-like protein (isoleucine patch superfamily)
MPIYALGDLEPQIHDTAFVHPDAVVIGDVRIGAGSSIWPCAVLRGDGGYIAVGERSSIQDGSVLHTTPEDPTVVGDDCLVGHIVHLEGCTLENGSFVGNGAIVLHRVIVRSGALVGANAVVNNDVEVPSGAMALGIPAKIRPDSVRPGMIEDGVAAYVERAQFFKNNLRRLD